MTSSIVNWKYSTKNGRPWKSQEFMVLLKFLRSVNLSDNITDSVIFSNFSENHRKVRKLSIWLNQQAMEISTFLYEKFSFFRSDYCSLNYTFCYFFLFLFSSHMTRKSSQEKSSYRLWNSDSEFWTIIWLVIYQKKARDL